MFAVKEQFGPGEKWMSIMMKVWAIGEFVNDPRVDHWVSRNASGIEIADPLVHAIATARFSPRRWTLKIRDILRLAKRYENETDDER